MTNLQERIYRIADSYAGSDLAADNFSAIATTLDTPSIVKYNKTAWTYAALAELPGVGLSGARIVAGTVQAAAASDPLMGPTDQALSNGGLTLWNDVRQATIDALSVAGSWEVQQSGLTATIKEAGRYMITPWKEEGLAVAPTAQDISDAKVAKAAKDQVDLEEANRNILKTRSQTALNAVMSVIEAGSGDTDNATLINAFSTSING